ncbi:hypothetical protein BZA05DRAFT_394785 [Tricharina praecox]|uniref:uncharacterized protein n=1 Tax=Tricharina praecox TaxID=43433 RepID=UPI0022203ECC|nr:uncharacterized protein BZA05DRAFT_394785 [Tricharina praecox]KAI5853803.1 hypothetical protein BZA05DRAFT_394785 [Tricharina praecox]
MHSSTILIFVAFLAAFVSAVPQLQDRRCPAVTRWSTKTLTQKPKTSTKVVTITRTKATTYTRSTTLTRWRSATCPPQSPITITVTATPTVPPTPTSSPACPAMPVSDPSFENEDWEFEIQTGEGTSLSYATSPSPRTGSRYLLSVFSASLNGFPGRGGQARSRAFAVCGGRRYRFSAWTNNFNLGAYAIFTIDGVYTVQTDMSPATNVWTQVTTEWLAPPNGGMVKIAVGFAYSRELTEQGLAITHMGVDDATLTLIA